MMQVDEELEEAARRDEIEYLAAELHREWRERQQPCLEDWVTETPGGVGPHDGRVTAIRHAKYETKPSGRESLGAAIAFECL